MAQVRLIHEDGTQAGVVSIRDALALAKEAGVQVMAMVAQKITPRQIVTAVWGPEYTDETGYIRRYVWHLRRKLEEDPKRPRYILNERSVGYFFPASGEPGS